MTGQAAKPRPIGRVAYHARGETVRGREGRFAPEFVAGEPIRAVALIRNDGMYPHKDVGEALVRPGDRGVVRESWRFLGEIYYTVGFFAQSVFIIMRGREMARIGTTFAAEI